MIKKEEIFKRLSGTLSQSDFDSILSMQNSLVNSTENIESKQEYINYLLKLCDNTSVTYNALILLCKIFSDNFSNLSGDNYVESAGRVLQVLIKYRAFVVEDIKKCIGNNSESEFKKFLDMYKNLIIITDKNETNVQKIYSLLASSISAHLTVDSIKEEFFTENVGYSDGSFGIKLSLYQVFLYIYLTKLRRSSSPNYISECDYFIKNNDISSETPLTLSFIIQVRIADIKKENGLPNEILSEIDELYRLFSKGFNSGDWCSLAQCAYDELQNADNFPDEKEYKKYIQKGIEYIENALKLNPDYAKYYILRAQLRMLMYQVKEEENIYNLVEEDINMALKKQKSDTDENRVIKIRYEFLQHEIEMKKMSMSMKKQREEFDEAKKNNIKILSLFISIGTFVMGMIADIKNVINMTFNKTVGLFIMMLGIAITIYSIMDIFVLDNIFPTESSKHRKLKTVVLKSILLMSGIALIIIGVVLGNVLP